MGFGVAAWCFRLAPTVAECPSQNPKARIVLWAHLPRFVLDLRRAVPGSAGSGFVFEDRRFRSIGAVAGDEQFHPLRLRESFDAVVWIEKTTAAVPLAP